LSAEARAAYARAIAAPRALKEFNYSDMRNEPLRDCAAVYAATFDAALAAFDDAVEDADDARLAAAADRWRAGKAAAVLAADADALDAASAKPAP